MRLILLRHGLAKKNLEDYIAGKYGCKGLTSKGQQQAEQLAKRLKTDQGIQDILLSTSVKRAYETAEIVSSHLNWPIQVNDDLCELLPGDADGLTSTQYHDQYGEFDLMTNPDKPFAPNGESWHQFIQRVQTTLDTLYETYQGQNVVAVTHAGFIVVSFLLLFNIPLASQRARINPGHTSITE